MVTLIHKGFTQTASCDENNFLLQFMESRAVKEYPYPALVDADKAASLLSSSPSEQECEKILALSRFSFMGTDGMRGKVFTEDVTGTEALCLFTQKNILSGKIISLAVKSFVMMLQKTGVAKCGDTFCTGNDGRDAATQWKLTSSMNSSFLDCGMNVADIGTTPTPYVPLYMLENNIRGGAMLTASHNPSNQNGIKFFLDGKKLLNEGEFGSYALSAYMYELAVAENVANSVQPGTLEAVDYSERRKSFLRSNLPRSFAQELRKTSLFIDAANGSWTETTTEFLKENEVPFVLTSVAPTGVNINAGCGVAEIEGHDSYSCGDIPLSPEIVKAVYQKGTESKDDADAKVFGIAVDGDGDRGFVLQYERESDSVKVYDGDEEAFLIASFMKAAHGKKAVCTVESDVMAPVFIKETLGTDCDTVDVGDKWVCNYPEDKLLIGFESSGHVIIPCKVTTPAGEKTLLSGNGMLTAIYTILSLLNGNKSFCRGFSKTYYTYFVDKNLFYPDSEVWNEDVKIIEAGLRKLPEKTDDSKKLTAKRTAFNDPDVLAYSVYEDDMQTALIFSRNSGTEDKNAVYLKCRPTLKDMLLPIADALCSHHREKMRNKESTEFMIMQKADKLFAAKGFVEEKDLTDDVQLAIAVLHALEREGKNYKRLFTD